MLAGSAATSTSTPAACMRRLVLATRSRYSARSNGAFMRVAFQVACRHSGTSANGYSAGWPDGSGVAGSNGERAGGGFQLVDQAGVVGAAEEGDHQVAGRR